MAALLETRHITFAFHVPTESSLVLQRKASNAPLRSARVNWTQPRLLAWWRTPPWYKLSMSQLITGWWRRSMSINFFALCVVWRMGPPLTLRSTASPIALNALNVGVRGAWSGEQVIPQWTTVLVSEMPDLSISSNLEDPCLWEMVLMFTWLTVFLCANRLQLFYWPSVRHTWHR